MSDLRIAAQQALDAIESDTMLFSAWTGKMIAARTTLRAALAQQAEPVATVAENATTQQRVVETPPSDYRRGYWDGFNIGKREGRIEAEDALAQQAEPVEPVEPVAWHYTNNGGCNVMHWGPSARLDADIQAAKDYPRVHKVTPLYTAPPQRLPLTKEEIYHATGHCGVSRYTAINIARAVEKASWEKNHG